MTDSVATAVVERLYSDIIKAIIGLGASKVIVLEPPTATERRNIRALEQAGIKMEVPDFFAGHLKSRDGDSAWVAAGRVARTEAPKVADRLIRQSTLLTEIDRSGRKGTLALHLSKSLQPYLMQVAVRLEVARAMGGSAKLAVWVDVPSRLPLEVASEMATDLQVFPVRSMGNAFFEPLRPLYDEVRQAFAGLLTLGHGRDWRLTPTILTVCEEDLSDDRSYRGQLHWLDIDRAPPRCRVVMLPQRGLHRNSSSPTDLGRRRITVLTDADVSTCVRRARAPIQTKLSAWGRGCLRELLSTTASPMRFAMVRTFILLMKARRIAAVVEATSARSWVGCESFLPEADAVNLIADECGLKTAAWQYSAMMTPTLLMLATSDVVATFSDYFAPLYAPAPVGPRTLYPIGYPFGDVPSLVRERAQNLRQDLHRKGARYVVCFFDESIAQNRWHGLINRADHLEILEGLARYVINDPEFAVIYKPKYAYDAVARIHPESRILRDAASTGRFVHLVSGIHRNEVFAAEAAMSADLCLGFLAGATAALEAVIAGSRAVLLRHRGEQALLDPILAGMDVIYESVDAALEAIALHRAKEPSHAALGDWTSILPSLDAGRDGKAPVRLRTLLEGWALGKIMERELAGDLK